MKTLHIAIHDKVAVYQQRDGFIVCGNSDYQIQFTFDSEWDIHTTKTARFVWGGKYTDVEFTGDVCAIPIVHNTRDIKVGVYAGDLSTTTSATIRCERSILCEESKPSPENDKNYTNEAKEAAERAEAAAARTEELLAEYITEVDELLGGDA